MSRSSGQVLPPGSSCSSAYSADSSQVTAEADGSRPVAARSCRLLLGEAVLVVTAAGARVGHHRAGLGERGRLAAQVLGQVIGPAALVLIGAQPAEQVGHRLAHG